MFYGENVSKKGEIILQVLTIFMIQSCVCDSSGFLRMCFKVRVCLREFEKGFENVYEIRVCL